VKDKLFRDRKYQDLLKFSFEKVQNALKAKAPVLSFILWAVVDGELSYERQKKNDVRVGMALSILLNARSQQANSVQCYNSLLMKQSHATQAVLINIFISILDSN